MKTNTIIEVRISDIQIGDRFRKDMGDLEGLSQSISEVELLQPIGITPEYKLIFGERRLRAYRDILGRETIPARMVDLKSVLLGQIDENALQKGYTLTEQIAIVDSLGPFKHGGDRRSHQARNYELGSLTLADACKLVGISEDSYRRAKEVEQKGVPELVAAMDSRQLSLHAAEKLAKASPEEQNECLTKRCDEGRVTARGVEKQLRRIRHRKEHETDLARAIEAPKSDDDIQIHHCPFQILESLAGLSPNSVPLICTDIPYGGDFIEQIEELAALAERVLVPGGTLVAYIGQHRLNEKMALLDKHLTYQWIGTAVWEGVCNDVPRLKLVSNSIPLVIYSKGQWQPPRKWHDTYITNDREKDWHHWQRPLAEVEKLVCYFSRPGDLVIDTCGGGFTTAIACLKNHRRFIGCDIDKAAVAKGQERLAQERRPEVVLPMVSVEPVTVNSIVADDCRKVIPRLPDNSIALGVMSPPYAEQRKGQYPGVPEGDYPNFTVEWMSKLWPKLTDDGSVLIVIDPHVENGVLADYVLRTQLALRDAGWKQHMPLMWLKENRCPLGHVGWPRHAYEQILWFSKTAKPFCDPKAGGEETEIAVPCYRHSQWSRGGKSARGIKRHSDVIDVPVGLTPKGVDHPAMFPVELAEQLIQVFCRPGGIVFDGFAGSGNSLLAAARLGHPFFGCDIKPEYVEVARRRLAEAETMPKAG